MTKTTTADVEPLLAPYAAFLAARAGKPLMADMSILLEQAKHVAAVRREVREPRGGWRNNLPLETHTLEGFMIKQIRTGQPVPYLHECAAGKPDDHDGALQLRARALLNAGNILIGERHKKMGIEQLAAMCERATVRATERLALTKGAELFAALRGQVLNEYEIEAGMAYTLPESSDDDAWALFLAMKSACDADGDLRTPWCVPEDVRAVVRRMMLLCAGPETADDFAAWGRWHRAANALQGKINLIARSYYGEVLGTEYTRLPLGDWTWHGLIDAMRAS